MFRRRRTSFLKTSPLNYHHPPCHHFNQTSPPPTASKKQYTQTHRLRISSVIKPTTTTIIQTKNIDRDYKHQHTCYSQFDSSLQSGRLLENTDLALVSVLGDSLSPSCRGDSTFLIIADKEKQVVRLTFLTFF